MTTPSTIQSEEKPAISPILVMGIGVLAVSVSAVLIRWAQQESVSSLTIAAWRTGAATLMLLPFAIRTGRRELAALTAPQWGLAMISGLFLGIHFASWISSLNYTSVSSSTVLVTTNPIWVALASPFLLNEKLTRPLRIGIGLAIFGSIVITVGDAFFGSGGEQAQANSLLGNGLALVGAFTAAGYMIAGRKLRPRLSLIAYTSVVYGVAGLSLIIYALINQIPLFGFSPYVYLLLILMAIFPQLIGHSSFNYALRYLPAAFVSVTILGEPIGASILAIVLLREFPAAPWMTLIGSIFIFGGIFIASRPTPQTPPSAPQPAAD